MYSVIVYAVEVPTTIYYTIYRADWIIYNVDAMRGAGGGGRGGPCRYYIAIERERLTFWCKINYPRMTIIQE